MSALLTKLEEYKKTLTPEDSYSSQAEEIVSDFKALLKSARVEAGEGTVSNEKILSFKDIYIQFPSQLFEYYGSELFDAALDFCSENIYRTCGHMNITLDSSIDFDFEIKNEDELALRIILDVLKKTSPKEVVLYAKNFYSKKIKAYQKYFIVMELILFCIVRIERKDRFMKELLPFLSRVLNKSLEKYVKYKGKLDRNEYNQTPIRIAQYQLHYEGWIRTLISRILSTLINIIQPSKVKLLTINEIYNPKESGYKKMPAEPVKLMHHFSLLFIFDLLEGLIDVKANQYFEESERFVEQVLDSLHIINSSLQDYLYNFFAQVHMLLKDEAAAVHNKRDESSLLISDYDKLTMYNPAAMAFLALTIVQQKESSVLSHEHKVKLLLNGLHELIKYTPQKKELKGEILDALKSLMNKKAEFINTKIDNLNHFGFPLHELVYNLLDFIGGAVDEKISASGVEVYRKLKTLINDKPLAKLYILAIKISKNYALSGFLISEFKSGVNAILMKTKNEDLHEIESPFLDVQILHSFFCIGVDTESKDYKDDIDLAGSCINFLIPISLKHINLDKLNKEKPVVFKDKNSVFNPVNRGNLISLGEKIRLQEKKMVIDFEMLNQKIKEAEEKSSPDLQNLRIRENQLLMIKNDIERVQELLKDLKSL